MNRVIKSLQFDNVTFRFENEAPTFKNVTIDFPMDTVNVLRGERGAGRSTLLQLLSGLQMPTQGNYKLNEKAIDEMSFEEFLPYRLRIGYAFDLGGLISNRSLYENLVLPLSYHKIGTPEQISKKVMTIMERFNMIKSKDMRPAHVSGTLRRVTCLLRSIILDPEVLVLDDPTVGLSKELQQMFADVISELIRLGITHTLFISSYEESFISQFEHTNIYLEGENIFLPPDDKKRVVNL